MIIVVRLYSQQTQLRWKLSIMFRQKNPRFSWTISNVKHYLLLGEVEIGHLYSCVQCLVVQLKTLLDLGG